MQKRYRSVRPGYSWSPRAQDLPCVILKENTNLTLEALQSNFDLFFKIAFLNQGSPEPQNSGLE